jgi:hypothetical protein
LQLIRTSYFNHCLVYLSILNVVVSSKYPREFLKYSAERGCSFVETPERKWLLQARCGWQDVAIVVCERLPIEPKYERWLMFAPATTQTWRNFLKMLAQERNIELLKMAQNMRPKEYDEMSPELEKIFAELEAEEPERYSQDWFEVIQHRFPMLKPNQKAQLLASLTSEERTVGLTPEEKLASLTSEERLAGLTPEERLTGLTSEEMQELLKDLQKKLGQQPN